MAKQQGCATLHIVPDVYTSGSTKTMERDIRTGGSAPTVTLISAMAQKLPVSTKDMKSFMSSGENKNVRIS